MNYQIISDGSCDLGPALAREHNITVVPFYVSFDYENYQKEIEEIGIRDFYEEMVRNPKVFPKSSMPSVHDYVTVFEPLAEAGTPIICICITSKFSGSLQSAKTARDMILEDYPDAEITVIDSTINTVLQGIFVLEAVKMRDSGMSYEDTVARLEKLKSTGRIFFTVGDLEYLKHGGRIGKLTGIAGSILGIKPLITLKEGEIFSSGITRSRKKALQKVLDLLLEYVAETGKPFSTYSLCIGAGYDLDEAKEFQKMALDFIHENVVGSESFTAKDIPVFQIGATISVHTGPYPIGIGIVEKAL